MTDARSRPEELLACDAFVRRLARSLVRDAAGAEDLAQRALVAGLESGPREPASLRAWLAGTLRRMAQRDRRDADRRAARERAAARPEAAASVAEIVERESARRRVVAALLELDEPYRSTLVLRFYEGLPPRRIAQRMGAPVETVRTRTKRGLALLRARLDEGFEGGRSAWCALLAPLAARPVGGALVEVARSLCAEGIGMSTKGKLLAGVLALAGLVVVATRIEWSGGRGAGERGLELTAREPAAHAPLADESAGPARVPTQREAPREAGRVSRTQDSAVDAARAALGSIRVLLSWSDGRPAEEVWVRALPWAAAHPQAAARMARTDARGEARLDALPAGWVSLMPFAGGSDTVELAAGAELVHRMQVPQGYSVLGRVVDETLRPVAGAELWLSVEGNTDDGAIVARSDGRGEFRLRSVHGGRWIGARSPRHGPSLMKMLLEHPAGTELELQLVLRGACGAVEGLVRAPGGAPVADALVRVGPDEWHWRREGSEEGAEPTGVEARTDAQGRFLVEGLAIGEAPLLVRAKGFGPWRGAVQVVAGAIVHVDVELASGLRVSGVVRDAAGEALAGVEITSGHWGKLGHRARSDSSGAYELVDLPVGEIELFAEAGERGKARTLLHGLAGASLRWDPLLSTGGELRGRVLSERGEPLAGWTVSIESLHEGGSGAIADFHQDQTATDAVGGFVLRNLEERDHALSVRAPEGGIFPSLVRRPVRPGPGSLDLYVPDERVPSVFLRGRVLLADGSPASAAILLPWSSYGNSPIEHPQADGGFRLGPYPPGEWRLHLGLPGQLEHRRGPRGLAAGETWELGTIQLSAPGSLELRIARASGAPEQEPALGLRYGGSPTRDRLERQGELWRAESLAPGDYEIEVCGTGFAQARHAFLVREAETARVEILLEPGTCQALRIEARGAATDELLLDLVLRDARGRELFRGSSLREAGRPWERALWLAPGEYALELRTQGGAESRATLRIPSADAPLEPLHLRLP